MKKLDSVILLDIDNTLFNIEKLKKSNLTVFELYDEVKDTLTQLSEIATLGIFSQGKVAFQNKKLQETNIHHYFSEEHKHIVQYKLDVMQDVLRNYEDSASLFFVDDWLEGLRMAKKYSPSVFTVWMKRGEYAYSQKEYSDFTPDEVISNLHELISLIQKEKPRMSS